MAQDKWVDFDDQWVDFDDVWVDGPTDVGVSCPTDCTNCCYEILVTFYYLGGESPAKYSCNTYNGTWMLTQQGVSGIDCEWLYTDPADGFTITIACDGDYWWLTIAHDGDTAARWKQALASHLTCPPTDLSSWTYEDGDCTGNPWAYTECHSAERPVFPPAWYHDDLLGVLRYWRQF